MTRRSTPTYSTPDEVSSPLSGLVSNAFATQDLEAMKSALDGINVSAIAVSQSLSKAFTTATQSGRSFNDTLATVAASLAKVGGTALGGNLGDGFGSLFGGVFSGGGGGDTVIAPFADGGIVASPTYFGSGGSMGLMGERGAEAILPLSRGPNGQLGIAAQGSQRAPTINVQIATNDAESFRRSETQVSSLLARAVARGQRGL